MMLVAAALLAACVGDEPVSPRPSVDPEVTLRNVDPNCVRGQLLKEMLGQGFAVRVDSETALVVGRVRPATAAGPLTLRYAPPPSEELIRFNYVPLEPRVLRITLQAAMLLHRDTGLERAELVRAGASDAVAFASKMQVAASRCR